MSVSAFIKTEFEPWQRPNFARTKDGQTYAIKTLPEETLTSLIIEYAHNVYSIQGLSQKEADSVLLRALQRSRSK